MGERREPQGLVVVVVDVVDGCGKGGKVFSLFAGRVEVARNAADPGDMAVFSDDGLFEGEAPPAASAGVEVEFEVIADGAATTQDFAVLQSECGAKRRWKKFVGGFSERRVFSMSGTPSKSRSTGSKSPSESKNNFRACPASLIDAVSIGIRMQPLGHLRSKAPHAGATAVIEKPLATAPSLAYMWRSISLI